MNAVAAGAANAGLGVRRALEVRVRPGVAAEALRVYCLWAKPWRIEDLGYIAAADHVRLARAVAVLAGDAVRLPCINAIFW